MYYTTGFRSGEIKELCALVAQIQSSIPLEDRRSGRRSWAWEIQALLTFLWVGFMIVRVVVGRGRRG